MTDDPVDHPKHYNAPPSGVECIAVVEHMSFNLGNAMKYLWRADQKGRLEEDFDKAIWYINRERERLQALKRPSPLAPKAPASSP